MVQDLILVYLFSHLHLSNSKVVQHDFFIRVLPNLRTWCQLVLSHFSMFQAFLCFSWMFILSYQLWLDSYLFFKVFKILLAISLNVYIWEELTSSRYSHFSFRTRLTALHLSSKSFISHQKMHYLHCLHKDPEHFLSVLPSFAIIKLGYSQGFPLRSSQICTKR